jgi:hypothetical protein
MENSIFLFLPSNEMVIFEYDYNNIITINKTEIIIGSVKLRQFHDPH